jgi:hypothetical protein
MEAAAVRPCALGGAVAELNEDAAHHLVGPALAAKHFELSHHAVERDFDAGDRVMGVAIALAVQAMMAALEFLAVELREQGHTKQRVHVGSVVSERQLPL